MDSNNDDVDIENNEERKEENRDAREPGEAVDVSKYTIDPKIEEVDY